MSGTTYRFHLQGSSS